MVDISIRLTVLEKKKYLIKETQHKSYLGIVHYALNRTHAWIIYIVFTFQYIFKR